MALPTQNEEGADDQLVFRGSIAWLSGSRPTFHAVGYPTPRKTRFRVLVRLSRTGFYPQGSNKRFLTHIMFVFLLFQASWHNFSNDFPLRWEDTVEAFRILALKAGWGMFFASFVIRAFFVGFWIVVDRYLVQITKNEKILFQCAIVVIGVLALAAYLLICWLRQRYLKRRSPLLECQKQTRTVSIHNHARSFQKPRSSASYRSPTGTGKPLANRWKPN